ncbi:uncharacterized protein LOC128241856 [Mya arenaria]|nr:uncharacterized protein LOC128241856 [Mya arenaria]XP_052814924.1 uncharacterized protein LOC128241856 [Mya arenaria]
MQPSGYDDKTNFEQVDFNGIAAFISYCGRFSATTESLSDQARDSTNKIRHMPDICSSALKDQATTDYIDTLAKLLNDPKFNGGKDVQEALKQLAELKTTFPELLGEHWKFIIEDIATKCLQDIHDLCKDEKEIWRKEADQKRADFQFLGDNILSKLTAKGETVLGDIKKLMEISQKTIVNSIGDGIKQIEARTEIGERTIYERTETGYQKLDNKTKIGERKIDEKTEKGKQMILEKTEKAQRVIKRTTQTGKRKIEDTIEMGEHKIKRKIKELDGKSGRITEADLRKELLKLYKKTASTVRIRLDIDEALGKVYEAPKLTLKKNGKDEEDDLCELENIFRSSEGTLAKTIVVEGEPGSGKSSLCKKIVHDWCETKHEGRTETERHDLLSQFAFVFYITLREAKNECFIKEMIMNNIMERIGFEKSRAEDILVDILKTNNCLLLLDGLDEWQHPDGCNLDERIPHVHTSWENCSLLITTRPYKLAELKISLSQIDNHVMLKGVANRQKLVEKIVSRLNELRRLRTPLEYKICITDIQEKNLWHFSECPILLTHLVWLWYKRKLSVDMRYPDLYRSLLVERLHESCGSNSYKTNDVINALSQIAFEKLFAEDEKSTTVFEINEEENTTFASHKASSLKSGIISCINVPGDSPQYHFLHKTFQEYLAALFMAENFAKRYLRRIKRLYTNKRSESVISLSSFFCFLCGLNTKAAEELSKIMNQLFTDFCHREGYSFRNSSRFQYMILQGQIELDKINNSGVKLRLQHINIHDLAMGRICKLKWNDDIDLDDINLDPLFLKKEKALEQLIMTNKAGIVSLSINTDMTLTLPLANSSDNKILDLENCKGLKFLNVYNMAFKDVTGLVLSNLIQCSIKFKKLQKAPNLTSTFFNADFDSLKKMKMLKLANMMDLSWLHEDSERTEHLDLRRLGNQESLIELQLNPLSYPDVVNLPVRRLHTLQVGFNELQKAPQLMSTLLAHGTCQNERKGLSSHLKHVTLSNIRMTEEQFRRLPQSFEKAGSTTCELIHCCIEQDENVWQLDGVNKQQVTPFDCTTNLYLSATIITVEMFIRLVDWFTICGQSGECHLTDLDLKANLAVAQPSLPLLVSERRLSADYTTKFELTNIKMSKEQICQIVGRMNQLDHSVKLRLYKCSEILDEYNPLMNQMITLPIAPLDCTKHIEISEMEISEELFCYALTSVIHFGYTCKMLDFDILPNKVQPADNLEFSRIVDTNTHAHTAKLVFLYGTMPEHVFLRLASEAAESGHLVECEFHGCEVPSLHDDRPLREKLEEQSALQFETFIKVNPDLCFFNEDADQVWNIRFKTNAKQSQRE